MSDCLFVLSVIVNGDILEESHYGHIGQLTIYLYRLLLKGQVIKLYRLLGYSIKTNAIIVIRICGTRADVCAFRPFFQSCCAAVGTCVETQSTSKELAATLAKYFSCQRRWTLAVVYVILYFPDRRSRNISIQYIFILLIVLVAS